MKILPINNYNQTRSSQKTNSQAYLDYAAGGLHKDTVSFTAGKDKILHIVAEEYIPTIKGAEYVKEVAAKVIDSEFKYVKKMVDSSIKSFNDDLKEILKILTPRPSTHKALLERKTALLRKERLSRVDSICNTYGEVLRAKGVNFQKVYDINTTSYHIYGDKNKPSKFNFFKKQIDFKSDGTIKITHLNRDKKVIKETVLRRDNYTKTDIGSVKSGVHKQVWGSLDDENIGVKINKYDKYGNLTEEITHTNVEDNFYYNIVKFDNSGPIKGKKLDKNGFLLQQLPLNESKV